MKTKRGTRTPSTQLNGHGRNHANNTMPTIIATGIQSTDCPYKPRNRRFSLFLIRLSTLPAGAGAYAAKLISSSCASYSLDTGLKRGCMMGSSCNGPAVASAASREPPTPAAQAGSASSRCSDARPASSYETLSWCCQWCWCIAPDA